EEGDPLRVGIVGAGFMATGLIDHIVNTVPGLEVAAGWAEAPRPVAAEDLLPERALHGEAHARRQLVERVYRPLATEGTVLLETGSAYLEAGGSLEATARTLFVHANTVRYRLRRIAETVGLDLTRPRDAWIVRVALAYGRIAHGSAPQPGDATAPRRSR
ncbi:PucR family transcriptional regulator, partial [Ornithinicoccus halotolerans]|uniref:PucR family transcriptional regulator n=1 Tax=Ornithinicoccus halotolerans TaxID=1748220 RepID=UPI001885B674